MANIVRDDPVAHITTGGGSWSVAFMNRFFGGSAIWPAFASTASQGDTGQYGSLSMTFQGVYPNRCLILSSKMVWNSVKELRWLSLEIRRMRMLLNGHLSRLMAAPNTIHRTWTLLPRALDNGSSLRLFLKEHTPSIYLALQVLPWTS